MKPVFVILFASLVLGSFAFEFFHFEEFFKKKDLPVVDRVDIQKFKGHWYEIARLPYKGEKDCICSQQQICVKNDHIYANNTCLQSSILGEQIVHEFEMTPLDSSFAKFKTDKISDYYIIELDKEKYNFAMIGDPSRDFLWIASRQPVLAAEVLFKLVKKAKTLGFDVDQLVYQGQVCGNIFDENEMEVMEHKKDLPTVDKVEIDKFQGHWYEIARLPYEDEKGCLCAQEILHAEEDKILATMTCRRHRIDADLDKCQIALHAEDETYAKLKVLGKDLELYVVDLDQKEYKWAFVADPRRKHFWIKAREPIVDYKVIKKIVKRAEELGFPVERLIWTPQLCGNNF